MRLIDADELVKMVKESICFYEDSYVAKDVLLDIEAMLTIEDEPVRRGRWYRPKESPRNSYRFICDNCHDIAYYVTGNNGKKIKESNPKCGYRYCPNCGARMVSE